jgi:hypothetical protein
MGIPQNIRRLGFAVLAIAAIVVTFALGNAGASPTTTTDAVHQALVAWHLNEGTADSAPQQSVSAQWATKDLLSAIGTSEARQSSALGTKVPVLLLIGVLAVCWGGLTSGPIGVRRADDDGEPELVPGSPAI